MNQQNNEEKTKFFPVIQGSRVIQLKVNNKLLRLKKELEVKEFTDVLLPLLQKLENYINLETISVPGDLKIDNYREWDQETLEKFLEGLTLLQKVIFWIILQKGKIMRSELLKELNKMPPEKVSIKKLAAEVAGMTRKWNRMRYEPLLIIQRSEYRVNQKVAGIILNTLKPVACMELGWVIENCLTTFNLKFGDRQIINGEEGMAVAFHYDHIMKGQKDSMLSFQIVNNDYPVDEREPLVNLNPKLVELHKKLIESLEKKNYEIIESKIINASDETVYIRALKKFIFDIYFG